MYQFGSGTLIATQTQDANGNIIALATPVQFGTLQDVSFDFSFETKPLYGSKQFPVAIGRGKGKITGKAKMANIVGQIFGDLFFGISGAAGEKSVVTNYATAVPATSPFTVVITPPNSGTYTGDLGVINIGTGLPLNKVSGSPSTGQYSVSNTGTYTFASADANLAIAISYSYSATSTAQRNQTISNLDMGYAPFFSIAFGNSYSGKKQTLVLNRCTSSKLALAFKNDDFTVPELNFDAMSDASGNIGYWATAE